MDVKVIGEKIKKRRAELGITQKQLAQSLNISNQLVSKWENGESVPSLEYLDGLCRALNVTFSYFTGENTADNAEFETEISAQREQPAQPALPEQALNGAVNVKRKFNLRLFLIIFCSVFGALVIAATALLTYYVFVPAANKERYMSSIERSHNDYFALGYYSIHYRTEIDGDEADDYTCNGYFEEDGSVAFSNGRTGQTVKDGFLTYEHDKHYKYTYVQTESYGSLDELALSQVFGDEEVEESAPLDDIKYIRKVKGGYYLELRDEYFTDGLTGTQKKNYKLLDKIKGSVKIENGLLSSMSVTVKYRNKPDNENFTVYVIIEFIPERPVIEHTDLEDRELYKEPVYEDPEDKPQPDLPTCENKVDMSSAISSLTGGAAKKAAVDDGDDGFVAALLDGCFYKRTSSGINVINPDNAAEQWIVKINLSDFTNVHIYNGKVYYSNFNGKYFEMRTLRSQDIRTGEVEELFTYKTADNDEDDITFNGRYAYYYTGVTSTVYAVYDLVGKKQVCSLSDMSVEYVDLAGNAYGTNYADGNYQPAMCSNGRKQILKGDDFYREHGDMKFFGDTVYTVDSRSAYEYEGGVYKKTVSLADARFKKGYRQIDGGYCFADESVFDKNIYNADGSVKGEISTVALQVGEKKERATCYRILEAFGDKLLVQLSGESGYFYAVYDIDDMTKPLCFTDAPARFTAGVALTEFVTKRSGDKTIIGVRNSADFAYAYDIWVI